MTRTQNHKSSLLPGLAFVLVASLAVQRGLAAAATFDDFESYAAGSNLHGQGGWAGWEGDGNAGALVSTNFSFSPTRSVKITGASDLVHTFGGATNGQWVFSAMQYIPSTSTGTTYIVLLNTYRPPFGTNDLSFSVQIKNDMAAGLIISDLGGGVSLPMVKGQWVPLRCEINLISNSVSEIYNDQLLSTHPWVGGIAGPGLNQIQALDLFANNAAPVYYDNVSLMPSPPTITCPANLTTNISGANVVVNYANPTVVNGALSSCTPASGSVFPLGTTLVTCTATNAFGTNGCTFNVTVNPAGPPCVACETWTPRALDGSWYSVASSADGNRLVAGSASQIYTSGDSGVTWTPQPGSPPLANGSQYFISVASSALGDKLVTAVISGQIYTSTDSGVTWAARESNRAWRSVASSLLGDRLVAAEVFGKIYTSMDSGVTWTARESNRQWEAVATSANGTKLVAVVSGGQVYTSPDSGVTWTARDSNRQWNSVASSADGVHLVAVVFGGQIYTSADSGVTWTPQPNSGARNWFSVASSADGSKLLAVEYGGQPYCSTDYGVTWTAHDVNRGWRCVASSDDGLKLVAADLGHQLYTSACTTCATPPVLTCAPDKTINCGSPWAFDPPTALGGCGETNLAITVLATITNFGPCTTELTRTWRATGAATNSSTCYQTVTLLACPCPNPPHCLEIACPGPITVLTCSNCAPVFYSVSAANPCCSKTALTCFPPSGALFPLGDTIVNCLATDNCGSTNQCSFVVRVARDAACCVPPAITQEPVDVVAPEGSQATFTVTATGIPAPGYTWYYEQSKLPSQTNPTLVLSQVQMANMGGYSVVVTNNCGSVTSLVAQLLVPPIADYDVALVVDVAPAARAGDNVIYSLVVTNVGDETASGLVLTGRWDLAVASLVGGSPGCTFASDGVHLDMTCNVGSLVPGQAATVTVTLAALADGLIHFSGGVTGVPGELNLANNFAAALTSIGDPPTITVEPQGFTTTPGSSGALSVTGNGLPPLAYQWRFNGVNIEGATDPTLSFSEIHASDAGDYEVIVIDSRGAVTSTVATILLTFPPQITAAVDTSRTLRITGSSGTDQLEVRLRAGDPATLEVDNQATAGTEFAFAISTFDRLVVELGNNDNTLVFNDVNGLVVGLPKTFGIYSGGGSNLIVASSAGLNLNGLPQLLTDLAASPDLAALAQDLYQQSYTNLMLAGLAMAERGYTNLILSSHILTNLAHTSLLTCSTDLFNVATLLANTASNLANEAKCKYTLNELLQYNGSVFTNCILGLIDQVESIGDNAPDGEYADEDPPGSVGDQLDRLGDQMESIGEGEEAGAEFLENSMQQALGGDDFYNRVKQYLENPGEDLGEVLSENCEEAADNFEDLAYQLLEVPAAQLELDADALTAVALNLETRAEALAVQAKAIEQLMENFTAAADPPTGLIAAQALAAGMTTGTAAGCDRDINANNTMVIVAAGVIIGTPLNDKITATTQGTLILGLAGDDLIVGSPKRDIVFGGTGNDEIHGGAGNDWLFGGKGNDCIFGDAGIDVVFGGEGDDNLHGGTNFDLIIGWTGNDKLFGDENTDVLIGYDGDDEMHGGTGIDLMFGGKGKDTMFGDSGQTITNLSNCPIELGNLMIGGADDDLMYGGSGCDVMFGNDGNDIMHGSNQVDLIFGNDGDDQIYGGDGGALFYVNIEGVKVGIRLGGLLFGGKGNDQVTGGRDHDLIFGGEGDDILKGSYSYPWWKSPKLAFACGDIDVGYDDDLIFGGPGNDTIDGGYGTDFLFGGPGNDNIKGNGESFRIFDGESDFIFGETGEDTLEGGKWNLFNFMFGGADNDTMTGGQYGILNLMFGAAGDDIMDGKGDRYNLMFGEEGDDTMTGGSLRLDLMFGGTGNDHMNGQGGFIDVMFGNSGKDLMYGGGGLLDLMFGGLGDDEMHGGPGLNIMFGNKGCDLMFGDDLFDLIFGNQDHDTIYCGNGLEIAFGNDGDDVIHGGTGLNVLIGGDGYDTLYGNGLLNLVFGGPGDDRIDCSGANSLSANLLFGNGGDDRIEGGGLFDLAFGGDGNDQIKGGNGINLAFGGFGNDTLTGGSGMNVLFGGPNSDYLYGGSGLNIIFGGRGDDADTIIGGSGNLRNILFGQQGDDTIACNGTRDFAFGNRGSDHIGIFGDRAFTFGNRDDDNFWVYGGTRALIFGGRGADVYKLDNGGTKRKAFSASSGNVNFSFTVPPVINCANNKTVSASSTWVFDVPTALSYDRGCGAFGGFFPWNITHPVSLAPILVIP